MRIAQDADGEVWVVHWESGLHNLTPASDQITHHPLPTEDGIYLEVPRSIYLDESGQIWTGSYDHALTRFDPTTGQYTQYQVENHTNGSIRAIVPDEQGNFWLALDDIPQNPGGLYHFNRQTESFSRYAADMPGFSGQSGTSARAILLDQDGILWIGYNDGLSRFDPITKHFSFYQHQPGNPNSLLSSEINALYQDDSGLIWVGTAEGLSRFNP